MPAALALSEVGQSLDSRSCPFGGWRDGDSE